jgi:hypothetical protein
LGHAGVSGVSLLISKVILRSARSLGMACDNKVIIFKTDLCATFLL